MCHIHSFAAAARGIIEGIFFNCSTSVNQLTPSGMTFFHLPHVAAHKWTEIQRLSNRSTKGGVYGKNSAIIRETAVSMSNAVVRASKIQVLQSAGQVSPYGCIILVHRIRMANLRDISESVLGV